MYKTNFQPKRLLLPVTIMSVLEVSSVVPTPGLHNVGVHGGMYHSAESVGWMMFRKVLYTDESVLLVSNRLQKRSNHRSLI